MKAMRGAIGVTVTPFDKQGRVNLDVVTEQARRVAGHPVTGLLPCASTGEFLFLSMEEQRDVYLATKAGMRADQALVGGACSPSLRQSIALAQAAADAGCDAVLACPPYYYPQSQDEVYRFYKALSEASPVPVVMYHAPFFSSPVAPETIRRLIELPNIAGIKDSSAHMKRIAHLCELHRIRPDFLIYTGTDDILLSALAGGADGSMTALGAGAPELVTAVYDAFHRGDLAEAMAAQQRMMPLLATADELPFPLGYKYQAQWWHDLPMTDYIDQQVDMARAEDVKGRLQRLTAELKG